ncbi:MAG TPA: rhomboid family intramembrane serine protease [Steroidobacteraceae bacterium]|nr:rhomboid family intramembrane serine protease [Steroidobacteraceae bacterium]
MLTEAIEVYRSARLADCDERAFVLTAIGVAHELVREGDHYLLRVDPQAAAAARAHLARYEDERRTPPPPKPAPPPLHSFAWLGCAVYAMVLFGVAYAVSNGLGRLDAFSRGELNALQVQHGEWWRAWTALTLHLSWNHLLANLGAGVWFGYLAGRLLGAGVAWALIVLGAGGANLLEGLLATPSDRAVGASTAVFAALGIISAHSWWQRRPLAQHWAVRWSPLTAGVVLLGWLGTSGEHTDVFAHLAGFACGVALGAVAATRRAERALRTVPQPLAGALALGAMALAWTLALRN